MPTLSNVKNFRGKPGLLYLRFTSGVILEGKRSPNGVYLDYIESSNYLWFVLCVTYNCIGQATKELKTDPRLKVCVPMRHVMKEIDNKYHRRLECLLSNILFVYVTKKYLDTYFQPSLYHPVCMKYSRNKFVSLEKGFKYPLLTVHDKEMMNFIREANIGNEHVRMIKSEHCHYKKWRHGVHNRWRVQECMWKGVLGERTVASESETRRVIPCSYGLYTISFSDEKRIDNKGKVLPYNEIFSFSRSLFSCNTVKRKSS